MDVWERRCGTFDFDQIINNLAAVAAHNKDFEIPDIIEFQDYTTCSKAFTREVARRYHWSAYRPDPLTLFPYPKYNPKSPGKVRMMALARPADLTLLRLDAGRIGEITDRVVSDRVCSYRLIPPSEPHGAWKFRGPRESWNAFRLGGVAILDRGDRPFMCGTDVTEFYPSVKTDLLAEMLRKQGCNVDTVARVMRTLDSWRALDQLRGLPIGPEASAVLANFFLTPIDQSIAASGTDHRRYGDDLLIFTAGQSEAKSLIGTVSGELRRLGLSLSVEKTKFFHDPEQARASLIDEKIDYWQAATFPLMGDRSIRRGVDEDILNAAEVNPSRFRWILQYLWHKGEQYRCTELACREDLMNIEPKYSRHYLTMALSKERVHDECMNRLAAQPQDHLEALNFHTLLALSERSSGEDERKEFERIAFDTSRRWPIRAAAWAALGRSDGAKPKRIVEAAAAEREPNLRRAMLTSLRRFASDRRCQAFLRELPKRHPETLYTVEWLQAA